MGSVHRPWVVAIPVHPNLFVPPTSITSRKAMTDDVERARFREHVREMREALSGIGKDIEMDVSDAPRLAKQGAKNALARAAGIRRTPMHEWSEPASTDRT